MKIDIIIGLIAVGVSVMIGVYVRHVRRVWNEAKSKPIPDEVETATKAVRMERLHVQHHLRALTYRHDDPLSALVRSIHGKKKNGAT
jgi:hypothetical protein